MSDYLEYCGRVVDKSCTTPISTIVYLADRLDEFKNCLFELKKSNPSIEYLYCVHKGEGNSEISKKDHIHLLLYSNATNGFKNCEKLRNFFILSDNEKSYAKNFIVTKSLGDAYNYMFHNKSYLDLKKEKRKYYYNENDVVGSDSLRDLCKANVYIESQLKQSKDLISNIINGLSDGLSKFEIVEKYTFNKSSMDYLASLNLVDKVEKTAKIELQNNYDTLKLCFSKYLIMNHSYESFSNKSQSNCSVLSNNDIIDTLLKRLLQIDLIEFLFNNKILFNS